MNKISFSINYITNFKPSKNFTENYSFFNNKSNIILCKHFIIFLYMLKFVLKKNTTISIFFKPRRNKIETLLRPPYRHKISRHQITLSRYTIVVSFFTKLNNKLIFSKITNYPSLLGEIVNNFRFFETNICYTHSIRIRALLFCPSFFELLNYKF